MNFKKVEKAAKKINQLLDNMRDEEQVSTIEKDLLLSYIRDLYEKVIYSETKNSEKPVKIKAPKEEKTSSILKPVENITPPTPTPVIEIADVVRQELQETITHQPEVAPLQRTIETSSYTPPVVAEEPVIQEQQHNLNSNISQELLEIFEKGAVSELSDKLSQSPIADLTKCMGINERIFTVNELFGGDTGLFNTTMQELNNAGSLEQARDYLVNNVAVEQNWGDASKIKKATNFVKLISRRY